MKCPRCKTPLCRIDYEGVPVHTCPDCRGELLTLNRLKTIQDRQEVTFSRAEAAALLAAETGPAEDKRLTCPHCSTRMAKKRCKGTTVVVDHCKTCSRVWLDDQEIEKLQVIAEDRDQTSASDTEQPKARFHDEVRQLAAARVQTQATTPQADEEAADDGPDDVVPPALAWTTLVGLFALMIVFVVVPAGGYVKSIVMYSVLAAMAFIMVSGTAWGRTEYDEATEPFRDTENFGEALTRLKPLELFLSGVMVIGAIAAVVVFEYWWHDKDVSYSVTQVWLLTLLAMTVIWLLNWVFVRQASGSVAAGERAVSWTVWLFFWACGYGVVWLLIAIAYIIEESE